MTDSLVSSAIAEVIVGGFADAAIEQAIIEIISAVPPIAPPALVLQTILEIIAYPVPPPLQALQSLIELVASTTPIVVPTGVLAMHSISSTANVQQQIDDNLTLTYSDTRGASWSNPLVKSLGASGLYDVDISFRRLGMSRDRIISLEWSAGVQTALTGVFILVELANS